MISDKEIVCPNNLLNVALQKKDITAGIVNAGKPLPMLSVMDAVKENLIKPIFIGNKSEIQKCAEQLKWDISKYKIINEPVENNTAPIAAKLAAEGQIKIIVKGHIHTDILGFSIPIRFAKSTTFLSICIFVFMFGNTFKAPSVIIRGELVLSIVICQI